MELLNEVKQLILEAKNICLIPQNDEPESLTAALALFYTLKELNKNVNLIVDDFPEKLSFLIPSLDFISSPKNFVISIPRNMADVSQIYYEKNEENLKIHLTIDRGKIKKENISFYFSEPKPNLIITLGIKDLQSQLSGRLDSFGFLLDATILNIDSEENLDTTQGGNKKFGKINLIENKSVSEIILNIIKSIDENLIKENAANCLLAGLMLHYEQFKSSKTTPEVFNITAQLIERGASHKYVVDNLNKITQKELDFLGKIFQSLTNYSNPDLSFASLDYPNLYNFTEAEVGSTVEKIKTIGWQKDLLVLWQSHASEPVIKGFFYSEKPAVINKIIQNQELNSFKMKLIKEDGIFLLMPGQDINLAKEKIIRLL